MYIYRRSEDMHIGLHICILLHDNFRLHCFYMSLNIQLCKWLLLQTYLHIQTKYIICIQQVSLLMAVVCHYELGRWLFDLESGTCIAGDWGFLELGLGRQADGHQKGYKSNARGRAA